MNWYNGSLDREADIEEKLRLDKVEEVAIIGNGNVSMDISRVLLKDPALMAPYDIPSLVLKVLQSNRIKAIQVVGRRGAV